MILEKAWAIINGGYDLIEGGYGKYIFELFLGCKCDYFKDPYDINSVFYSIKANEKYFGTLSLSSSQYYSYDVEDIEKLKNDFNREEALNNNIIIKDGFHLYNIKITLEMFSKETDSFKCLIISNPHGENSDLYGSGIELKKIEEILQNKFGLENKNKYEFILNANIRYPETGIIYMPLEYYKEWSDSTTVCYPHYSCLSYIYNIKNELECLYVFKIHLSEEQLFTCQVCFQSYRAHRDIIDGIKSFSINIEGKEKNLMDDWNLLLYYSFCGIKIIKDNENSNKNKKYYSYDDEYDRSSIKELNAILEQGDYFVIIYPESSINEGIIRFLSEDRIDIILKNKINKSKLKNVYNLDKTEQIFSEIFKNDNYNCKQFLKSDSSVNFHSNSIKEEIFLPGIKEYYMHFKKLAVIKDLSPEDAIYSITKEGNAYYYDIIEPYTLAKIFRGRYKNGEMKSDFINLDTIQFKDYLGFTYKEENLENLIKQMKINRNPCIFSEYDENTGTLTSSIVYIDLYYNKAKNEDILVISDKSKNFIQRIQKPLFIIILDISGSMYVYQKYLQNNIIPGLLKKLGYISKYKQLSKIINDETKKITTFEKLQAISNKYILKHFLETYDTKKTINLENFKNYSEDIILLITFTDDSELYFWNVYDFENCELEGKGTSFVNAANYLNTILNTVSRERSIRLLSFSDGEIFDKEKSVQILDQILNSRKTKHQMNSVSVRLNHGTEPDTEVLMKLSSFSYPIVDMEQIIIDTDKEKDINQVINKIYNKFKDDGMEYYLKLYSDIIFTSNDFSNKFSKQQFFNNKNEAFRTYAHKSKEEYQKYLKLPTGKIVIKDCGKLNEKSFYDIISKNAPYIAQRILERKVNQKYNSKENQDIINYFKDTEESFEKKNNNYNIFKNIVNPNSKKKRIYEYFQQINEDDYSTKQDINQLISDVKEETKKIIDRISQPNIPKQTNKKKFNYNLTYYDFLGKNSNIDALNESNKSILKYTYKKKFNYKITYGNFFGKKRNMKAINELTESKSFDNIKKIKNSRHNKNPINIFNNNINISPVNKVNSGYDKISNSGLYNPGTNLNNPLLKNQYLNGYKYIENYSTGISTRIIYPKLNRINTIKTPIYNQKNNLVLSKSQDKIRANEYSPNNLNQIINTNNNCINSNIPRNINFNQININNSRTDRVLDSGLNNGNASLIQPIFKKENLIRDRAIYNMPKNNSIRYNNMNENRINQIKTESSYIQGNILGRNRNRNKNNLKELILSKSSDGIAININSSNN